MSNQGIKKIAFYVSGKAGRLLKIIERYPGIIGSTALVINDEAPNEPLAEALDKRGINYIEFDYKERNLKGGHKSEYISTLLLEKMKQCNISYCFCFGSRILKGELLEVYENKIINFHPSILPHFPGVKAIDQALETGASILGNTAHFIDKGIDTGPIIMQSIMSRKAFNDYEDVLDMQLPMIEQILKWLKEDRIRVEKNKVIIDNAIYSKPLFYPEIEM